MKKLLFVMMTAVVMSMSFYACDSKKSNKVADDDEIEADVDDEDEDGDIDEDVTEDADFEAAAVELSDNPGEQLLALTKEFSEKIKAVHINSEADVQALKSICERYQGKIEAVTKAMEAKMAGMSEEEQMTYAMGMLTAASKMEAISKDMEKEVKRLEQEAAAAGLNIDDIDLD
jgi:hypothetical protein